MNTTTHPAARSAMARTGDPLIDQVDRPDLIKPGDTDDAPWVGDRPGGSERQRAPRPSPAGGSGRRAGGSSNTLKRSTHSWARKLHVYTSMVALVMILFFGLTGIVLNHPEWAFGDDVQTTTVEGDLPFEVVSDEGVVDYLAVSEYLRDTHGVSGSVDDYRADVTGGTISYANPGYSADAFFDLETGEYELTVSQDEFIAVMTDLHTGSDAGSAWGWVIDLSAGFLVFISLTGLVMQFFLRKRRRPALATAAVGAAVSIALIVWTLR